MKTAHYFEMKETMVHSSGLSIEISYSRRREGVWLVVGQLVYGSRGSVEIYQEEVAPTETLEELIRAQRVVVGALVAALGGMVSGSDHSNEKINHSEEQSNDNQY